MDIELFLLRACFYVWFYNWTVYLATYYLNVVDYANLAKNDSVWMI